MGYPEWIIEHKKVFGFRKEDELMLVAWCQHFRAAGIEPRELFEATRGLMANPPKWREDHLAAIQQQVREQRARAIPPPPANEGTSCRLCGDTGTVSVPSRKALAQREERGMGPWGNEHGYRGWGTEGVVCPCPAGMYWQQQGRANWTTLEGYQNERPNWRQELSGYAAALKREVQLAAQARGLDKTFGPLLDRLRRIGR
jgi:hypothetical protein